MKAVVKKVEISKTRRTLVISDIHGNLPFLKGLLDKVEFGPDDDLFALGDILEKSEGSLETLRFIVELSKKHTVHTLMGNCDNITLAFIDGRDEMPDDFFEYWFRTRKEKCTLVQMARLAGVSVETPADYPAARRAIAEQFRDELDFLRGLPHIFLSDDYLFVHGGVPREDNLEELDAYGCMKNDNFLDQGYSFRRWVIAGHTPVTLYRGDIPSAKPLLDYDRHIASIDGGCVLKADGQLNALILPREPGEDFSWAAYDGFPELTALDAQEASAGSVNIRWGHSRLEVLERGEELSRCRHAESGRVLDILTEYLWEKDGETYCEDSTDYRLPVSPGDKLSVVRKLSDRALCKKNGVTGWYFGRLK